MRISQTADVRSPTVVVPPSDPTRAVRAVTVAAVSAILVVAFLLERGSTRQVLVVLNIEHAAFAAAAAIIAWRRRRSEPDAGWAAIAVLAAVWLGDRVVTVLFEVTPLPGDGSPVKALLWLVGLPAGLFGIWRQAFGPLDRSTRWRVLADAAMVATSGAFVIWIAFRAGTGTDGIASAPHWESVALVVETALASVVLTAVVYQPRRRHLWWLAAAIALALLADLSALHREVLGEPPDAHGGLLRIPVLVVPALVLGFVLSVDDGPEVSAVHSPQRGLLYVPVAAALVIGAEDLLVSDGFDRTDAGLAVLVGVALAVNVVVAKSEAARAHRAVEEGDVLLRAVFDSSPIGIVVADGDGRILRVNAAMAGMSESSPGATVDQCFEAFAGPAHAEEHHRLRREVLTGARDSFLQDLDVGEGEGRRHFRLQVVRLDIGSSPGTLCLLRETTEQTRAREELAYLARHDRLTGLPNRAAFEEAVADALGSAPDDLRRRHAVAFVDLDQFKVVNDSLGHAAGDRLLRSCAEKMVSVVGARGTVARFGGDEFCVLLPAAHVDDHEVVLDRLVSNLRLPVEMGSETVYPTASIGVTLAPPGADVGRLFAEADAAMYRAKERGRNRIEWFRSADTTSVVQARRLVADLHRAVRAAELEVHHQRVVDLTSGRTVGTEALVRWPHPGRGLLPPAAFLGAAASAGLMVELGEVVLHRACAEAAMWDVPPGDDRAPFVAVNIDAQQLAAPGFVDVVAGVLVDTGLPADRLWLEITESALMADMRAATRSLDGLRALGVHPALDDFGTGYSSLTYLRSFPVEAIKIDRRFVDGIDRHGDDATIVRALVDLGGQLGLRVVAEGIETSAQLDLLRSWGCDTGQGYLLGRPVPVAELPELRREGVAAD